MRRVALVTGSETGIGRATAVALARAGYDVGVVWHDSEDAGRETVRRVEAAGACAALERLDLERHPGAAIDGLARAFGAIDVLVNVAGVNHFGALHEAGEDELRHVVDVNLTGTLRCTRAAVPWMLAGDRGGRIVSVSSTMAAAPSAGAVAYAASKAGVEGMTRALALELAPHGITVNAIAPGGIAVPRTGFPEEPSPDQIARDYIPLGRLGTPEDVATTIVHLASPDAAYVTGTVIAVDGGLVLTRATQAPAAAPSPRERVRRRLRR